MNYKNFPDEFWTSLKRTLQQTAQQKVRVAAFDADGTLWDTDLGEGFFKWQIRNQVIPNFPADPWAFYRKGKETDNPRAAYLWLAQINKGFPIAQVREWAKAFVAEMDPFPIFSEQRKLIDMLISEGVDVYVVTASVKWAVEPGALALGLPYDKVIGIQTAIENGLVTDKQVGAITWREGKPEQLLEVTGGVKPFFASGNTMGDLALLESATHLQLAVGAHGPNQELFQTEEKLRAEAAKHGWFAHKF